MSVYVDHFGREQIPNAYGQPAVIVMPYLECAAETWGHATAGDVGVEFDTFMCDTFLSAEGAIALGEALRKCGYDALRVRRRLIERGAAEAEAPR